MTIIQNMSKKLSQLNFLLPPNVATRAISTPNWNTWFYCESL